MFTFEALTADDLPFLIEIRNECRQFLHNDRAFSLEDARRWFEETKPDFRIIRYNGQPIGYFRLSNYNQENRSIYIGADLHNDFRGKGLARRAYEAFIPFVFESFGVSTLVLEVLSHNSVAQGLYRRLGFIEVDRRRGVAVREGSLVDSIIMELRSERGGLS